MHLNHFLSGLLAYLAILIPILAQMHSPADVLAELEVLKGDAQRIVKDESNINATNGNDVLSDPVSATIFDWVNFNSHATLTAYWLLVVEDDKSFTITGGDANKTAASVLNAFEAVENALSVLAEKASFTPNETPDTPNPFGPLLSTSQVLLKQILKSLACLTPSMTVDFNQASAVLDKQYNTTEALLPAEKKLSTRAENMATCASAHLFCEDPSYVAPLEQYDHVFCNPDGSTVPPGIEDVLALLGCECVKSCDQSDTDNEKTVVPRDFPASDVAIIDVDLETPCQAHITCPSSKLLEDWKTDGVYCTEKGIVPPEVESLFLATGCYCRPAPVQMRDCLVEKPPASTNIFTVCTSPTSQGSELNKKSLVVRNDINRTLDELYPCGVWFIYCNDEQDASDLIGDGIYCAENGSPQPPGMAQILPLVGCGCFILPCRRDLVEARRFPVTSNLPDLIHSLCQGGFVTDTKICVARFKDITVDMHDTLERLCDLGVVTDNKIC